MPGVPQATPWDSVQHSQPPCSWPLGLWGGGRCRTAGSLGRGCNARDGRGSPVWGSKWARGREAHPQQLLAQASARQDCGPERDTFTGSLRAGTLCTGSLGSPGEEQAPAGLGETTPQALRFTVNLVHLWPMQGCSPKGSQRRRACRGTPRALCMGPCSLPGPPRLSPPGESQRAHLLQGSYVSNTVCQHT